MYAFVIAFFLCLHLVKASSFYDNPEQDSLPLQDTPEDLHMKWDFEVRELLYDRELDSETCILTSSTVGIFGHFDIRSSQAHQVSR